MHSKSPPSNGQPGSAECKRPPADCSLKGGMETPPHWCPHLTRERLLSREERAQFGAAAPPPSTHKVKKTFVQRACHREKVLFLKKKCFSSRRNVCISSSSGGGFMPSLPSDPLCTSLIVSHLVSGIHKGPGPAPPWPFFRQFCVFVGPRLRLPPARPDRTHASRCQAQGHLRSLRGGEQRTRPGRASRTFCQPKTDR